MTETAEAIVKLLALAPHPEGGLFRETFRHLPPDGGRGALSVIYYLLRRGERSRWHRIDATEIWHFYAGAPLRLTICEQGAPRRTQVLGTNFAAGEAAHGVVLPGVWQTAESLGAWTLVGCTVAPAFEFSGFEIAAEHWEPKQA